MNNFAAKLEFYLSSLGMKTETVYMFGVKILKILVILILMYLIIKISNSIITRTIERQKKFKFSLDEKKAQTIEAIMKSLLRYSVYFFGIFAMIETLLGNIGLTFAGIGGISLGFGMQNLIKDVINGFFILFEDHFSVGDYINIDDKGGIVESIELRITKIRDFNGDLHIIPNGMIGKVTNHSRGNIRILVDVDIAQEQDVQKAIAVMNEVCEAFKIDNEYIAEGPSVYGVTAIKDTGITLRVVGRVKPMNQWDAEMKLRSQIKEAFKNQNILMAYPRMKIVKE